MKQAKAQAGVYKEGVRMAEDLDLAGQGQVDI
jgi:hypothetical protein